MPAPEAASDVHTGDVHTDDWTGCNGVGEHRFSHIATSIAASGNHAHIAMPEVHRVASLLKRWRLGTHQGAVSHDQLDYYLDEFTFRSTAATPTTAACSSTGYSSKPSRRTHTPTRC